MDSVDIAITWIVILAIAMNVFLHWSFLVRVIRRIRGKGTDRRIGT
jgi:hypothetical protein